MNKYQQLTKKTIKAAITAAVVLAFTGALYFAATHFEAGIGKQKEEMESQFNKNNGLLTSLRSQMDKSGEAEKKYVALQGARSADGFSATLETFKSFLAASGLRHRIVLGFKGSKEQLTDKQDLKNFPYDVMLRPNVEISFSAISDVHVFSFIHDLQQNAPGLVRINKMEIKRSSKGADLTEDAINKLAAGSTLPLVDGTIKLTWIRFAPKETNAAGAASATAAPSP